MRKQLGEIIMNIFGAVLGGFTAMGIFLFLAAIMGTCFGALGGWIVGLVFDETSTKILLELNIDNFKMWEIGAGLGFFGSFFRSNNSD